MERSVPRLLRRMNTARILFSQAVVGTAPGSAFCCANDLRPCMQQTSASKPLNSIERHKDE